MPYPTPHPDHRGADGDPLADRLPPVPAPRWPGAVATPDCPDFERSAKAWLFEMSPPRWWHEEALHRYPVELARMVRLRLEADIAAMQGGLRAMTQTVAGRDPARPDVAQAVEIYARERDWARTMLEHVKMVETALKARGASRARRRRTGAARSHRTGFSLPRPRPGTA